MKDKLCHIHKAVAYENCQLFSLRMEVFKKIIKNFPDEYNVIIDIVTSRMEFLLKNKRISKRLTLRDYYGNLNFNNSKNQEGMK